MWFAGALRTTLRDAGQDRWGATATASRAALGALFLLLVAVATALVYSIAGSGNQMLTSGERLCTGRLRVDFVPARDAYHGRGVWALAGLADLERALRGRGRCRRARIARRHHLAERWTLGTGRRLFALRLARHWPSVGHGRKPGQSSQYWNGVAGSRLADRV
jgi:hypothetical protein